MNSKKTQHRLAAGAGPCRKHALVIEDFPVIAMSIADELADMGYSTAIAATEAEAAALAQDRCPDLIIADSWLAQGSGIDAVRRICQDRSIAVIFMGEDAADMTVGATGAAGFLSKPFTSAALRSTIESAGSMSNENC